MMKTLKWFSEHVNYFSTISAPISLHLIIESPDGHGYLQLCTVCFGVLDISEPFFFYKCDILRQLDTNSFHIGTFQHS